MRNIAGALHLVKISGISGSAVNGTCFGSSHWKILSLPRRRSPREEIRSPLKTPAGEARKFPDKVENLKRWARFPGWNFRTKCRVPFMFLVVCTSSRSTVGHPVTYRGLRPNGTTFYQSEIPLLLPPNFGVFFLNGKQLPFPLVWQQCCKLSCRLLLPVLT